MPFDQLNNQMNHLGSALANFGFVIVALIFVFTFTALMLGGKSVRKRIKSHFLTLLLGGFMIFGISSFINLTSKPIKSLNTLQGTSISHSTNDTHAKRTSHHSIKINNGNLHLIQNNDNVHIDE